MIWPSDSIHLRRAAQQLSKGELLGVPTETVYGLAADAQNGEAVAKIYETKGRPHFNPLIVHVETIEAARQLAKVNEQAERLAAAFWPGPLTFVLPLLDTAPLASLVTAGLPTVALRSPAHEVSRALLRAFGRPFVAPSANRSGRISPTTADHVHEEFGGQLPVLDGGPCEIGLESTIIGLVGPAPVLLRLGSITSGEIEDVLGFPLSAPDNKVCAPGMMSSHYAPQNHLRLQADDVQGEEVLLGFGGTKGATLDLSPSGDLREAAVHLFAYLRELDKYNRPIAVASVPKTGLGLAINDRLTRAAAPRH